MVQSLRCRLEAHQEDPKGSDRCTSCLEIFGQAEVVRVRLGTRSQPSDHIMFVHFKDLGWARAVTNMATTANDVVVPKSRYGGLVICVIVLKCGVASVSMAGWGSCTLEVECRFASFAVPNLTGCRYQTMAKPCTVPATMKSKL